MAHTNEKPWPYPSLEDHFVGIFFVARRSYNHKIVCQFTIEPITTKKITECSNVDSRETLS